MIGKIISSLGGIGNHLDRLARYVAAEAEEGKAAFGGSRGFVSDDLDGQIIEMQSLVQYVRKDALPVKHLMYSFKQGEQPTQTQCEAIVDEVMHQYGVTDQHQLIWCGHRDTDNFHIHIMLNLVDPETQRVTRIAKHGEAIANDRVCLLIERSQGWSAEKGRTLYVLEDGTQFRHSSEKKSGKSRSRAIDGEEYSGEAAGLTIAKRDRVSALLKTATSWTDVHERLAKYGWTYERKGSGAHLVLHQGERETRIKPSDLDRAIGLNALEKRLGAFAMPDRELTLAPRLPEPSRPDIQTAKPWAAFIGEREDRANNKVHALEAMRTRHAGQRKAVTAAACAALPYQASASRDQRMIDASIRAAIRASHREILKQRQIQERLAFQKTHSLITQYEKWLEQRGGDAATAALEAWRNRHNQLIATSPEPAQNVPPLGISELIPVVSGGHIVAYQRDGVTVLIDEGQRVRIGKSRTDEDVLALLQLSQSKWPQGFSLNGDADFIEQATRVTAAHNMRLTIMNQPDFQDRVQFHHESKRRDLTPREQLFKEQCDTMIGRLKPDFCVVTLKNDSPIDAEKAAGGVAGRGQGFMEIPSQKDPSVMLPLIPADRVVDIIIETERKVLRVKRPWSVMFSPRSLTQSYLLLDDLDQEKRDGIKAQGYEPTYEQSTSPGSFHMVFAIPKIQDKIVGDEVVLRIIHLFVTDVGATGIDREMRLPGSCNGKPTRTLKDGTQPIVTVLGGTAQQCQKMNNLVRMLLLEIGERVPAQPQTKHKTHLELLGSPPHAPAPSLLSAVIWAPAQRYAQRTKGAGWTSEHDFHVAVALRSAGFTKNDIQSAIYSCAPRDGRDHAWIDYARRTADAVFNESGERAMSRLQKDKGAMRELNMDIARAKRDAKVIELRLDPGWCLAIKGERIEGVVEHLDIQRVMIRTCARLVEISMPPSDLPIESRKIGSYVSIQVSVVGEAELLDLPVRKPSQDKGVEF